MKIVFMGTPDFAAKSLEAAAGAGHTIQAAVTGEDKPVGRGNQIRMCEVKETALRLGIPVLQPHRVRGNAELYNTLEMLRPDIIIVAAYGQIIPPEILTLPRFGCINVHASLLPAYRGAAPIQWAVIDGQAVSGVTIMQMNEGLDTGDMLTRVEVPLAADETGGSLFDRLSEAGADLLVRTLDEIAAGTVHPVPQPADSTTAYARMIRKEDGQIDWTAPAEVIERLIRGLNPWPSAYTELDGKLMKIWSAGLPDARTEAEKSCQNAPDADASSGIAGADLPAPGTVVEVGKDYLDVQTGSGRLRILELQLAGKKRMKAGEFLRGCPVKTGVLLGCEQNV